MNELTKKDLERFRDSLTVGRIKEFIKKHDIPDDALILIQRVEDEYFDGYDISGMRGADTKTGIYPEGSKSEGWGVYLKKQDGMEEQYCPAFCCVNYQDEDDLLFIDLHY